MLQEPVGLLLGAVAHHRLDAGPVVPTAVEDHDLAGRREVRHVALDVHLGLLALGRGGQCDVLEHPRAGPLGDAPDRAALARRVPALEHDADLRPGSLDPLLHGDELALQHPHVLLVLLVLHLRRWTRGLLVGWCRILVLLVLLAHDRHSSRRPVQNCGNQGPTNPSSPPRLRPDRDREVHLWRVSGRVSGVLPLVDQEAAPTSSVCRSASHSRCRWGSRGKSGPPNRQTRRILQQPLGCRIPALLVGRRLVGPVG